MIDTSHPNVVSIELTGRQALRELEELESRFSKVLFVIDNEGKLVGAISDGDIRRGLLADKSIDDSIKAYMRPHPRVLHSSNLSTKEIKKMREDELILIPVIDDQNRIVSILNLKEVKTVLPIDVVIMAGGKGQRLRPLTLDTPKPMLHVGNKPIIEHNVDRLIRYGVRNFHITLNYLGEKISDHFKDGTSKGVSIRYVNETEPLGTLGSVGFIDQFENDHVLVMNSDLLTNIDFQEFHEFFIQSEADMAVASIPYNVNVPYAVLETSDGSIRSFKEKPQYTYYSNAGIYLFKRSVLEQVKAGEYCDATEMLQQLIDGSQTKVVSFPIMGYWLDIGRMQDYQKAQEDIKLVHFD